MPVPIRIPAALRNLTAGKDVVEVDAVSVKEAIDALDTAHSGIKDRLCEDGGGIRRFVNVYLNDEDIRFLNDLGTPLKDGDELSIVPAIAGG
jgi:molybdopterin synthase sulfur carrier subunit